MIRSKPKIGASLTVWATALTLFLGAMLIEVSPADAQSSSATLSGIVLDPHDAVVPDATVTVVSTGKKLRRDVTTDREGRFVVPLLPPDRYSATIQRRGFAIVEIKDLILNVNDERSIRIHLQVGQISESVIVEGASLAQTESAVVGTLVDRQFAGELPLNGRTFDAFLRLVPGAALSIAQSYEPGQFSINGQRPNANYFMVDGVGANVGIAPGTFLEQTGAGTTPPVSALGGTNSLVSVDDLQEFRVQTSSYAPEFGRTPGGQVSIITRSGTNEFHGTAFEYFRNEALDANDWFANAAKLGKPPLRQNDFGGVFGGPILRDRTFFFFSYEGLRLRLPQVALTKVPSQSLRDNAPASVQPLLKAFPIPNRKDFGNGLAEFNASFSNPSEVDATSIRIDHSVSNKLSLFGRYNYSPSYFFTRGQLGGLALSVAPHGSYSTSTLTLGATFVPGPKLSNDLRFNYSRVRAGVSYPADDFGGAVAPAASSLFPTFVDSANAQFTFSLLNATAWTSGPLATNFQRQVNVVDTLAVVAGPHSLRFGADYRRLSPISGVQEYNLTVSVSTMSEVLAGRATRAVVTANKGQLYPVFTNFSAYAQDTWRIRPRLTVTYGLRWELNPPPGEANGDVPFTVRGLDNPATMTLAPQGTPLFETTYGNLAPRVGVAYQLSQSPGREMVLRGGFGIFYDLGTGTSSTAFYGSNYPHSSFRVVANAPFPFTSDVLTPLPFSTNPPYPTLFVTDPHLTLPRTYQWNVAMEGSLGKHQSLSASYVGATGRRLLRQEYLVNPNPNFTDLYVTRNASVSDYNALQVQFNRRLSRGLQALASYTWSHSIDTVSLESSLNILSTRYDPSLDRGSSNFDIRHTFSAAAIYDIPKMVTNRLLRPIVNSWVVDAILIVNSAPPFNPIARGFSVVGLFGSTRPDLIPNVPLYVDDPTVAGGRRINRAAFKAPPFGQQGTLGRNVLRAFPVSQVDMALARRFTFTERWKLQLRAEAFNVCNHPNFAQAITGIANPDFGRATSMLNQSLGFDAGLNPLYQIGGPRSIQLALKLQF
jgi:Carboxypeptidase regulatory-like domain